MDAVRDDENILLRSTDIGHLSVAHQHETRNVPGKVEFRVEFVRPLGFPAVCSIVLILT